MAGGQQGSPLFFLGGLSHGRLPPPLCPHGVLRLPFSSPCLRGNGKEGLAERSLFSQRKHPLSLHLTPSTANPSTTSEGHRQHQSHARLHGQCQLPSHPSFPAVFPSVLLKGHTASPNKFSLGSSGTASSYLSHSFLALPRLLSSPHSPDWNRERTPSQSNTSQSSFWRDSGGSTSPLYRLTPLVPITPDLGTSPTVVMPTALVCRTFLPEHKDSCRCPLHSSPLISMGTRVAAAVPMPAFRRHEATHAPSPLLQGPTPLPSFFHS